MLENGKKQFKIPSGHAKGTFLEKADTKDISYWLNHKRQLLEEDPNHKYAASDRRWIAAAEAELRTWLWPGRY